MRSFQIGHVVFRFNNGGAYSDPVKYFISTIKNNSFICYANETPPLPYFFPTFKGRSFKAFLPRTAVQFSEENWPKLNKSWKTFLYEETSDDVKLYFFDGDQSISILYSFPALRWGLSKFLKKYRFKLFDKYVMSFDRIKSEAFFTLSFDKESQYEILQNEAD